MMKDVLQLVGATKRRVKSLERDGKPVKAAELSRFYDTDIDDAWNALTTPERLARWFLPVEGDLRLGGRYQLKGNAAGTITRCEPPRALHLTWEFAGGVSWVEVMLAPEGKGTRLTLMHVLPIDEHYKKYGPNGVGVGWDLGLIGLDLHLENPSDETRAQGDVWAESDDGKKFSRTASESWGEAAIADGADPEAARASSKLTADFYTGVVV